MSGPELPVIYENPRFDRATPTLWPVFDRSIRFTGLILMEWCILTLIEDSPQYLKVATIIIAGQGLAVHESWPWLRMRDWRWYPSLMATLVAGYLAILFYALSIEPSHKASSAQAVALPPPNQQTELIGGPYVSSDIQRLIPIFLELNSALAEAIQAFNEQMEIVQNWQAYLSNEGSVTFVKRLRTLAGKFVNVRAVVNRIIEQNNADRNELNAAVQDTTGSLDLSDEALRALIDNTQALATLPMDTQVRVLSKDIQRLNSAAYSYNAWVQASIQHVQTKIRRLTDYRP